MRVDLFCVILHTGDSHFSVCMCARVQVLECEQRTPAKPSGCLEGHVQVSVGAWQAGDWVAQGCLRDGVSHGPRAAGCALRAPSHGCTSL